DVPANIHLAPDRIRTKLVFLPRHSPLCPVWRKVRAISRCPSHTSQSLLHFSSRAGCGKFPRNISRRARASVLQLRLASITPVLVMIHFETVNWDFEFEIVRETPPIASAA